MEIKEFVKKDMDSLRSIYRTAAREIAEKSADDRLVSYAYMAMREKLEIARATGRGGWWDSETCSIDQLRGLLREHLEKGDMVDVMNFAAMIYARECADT